MANVNHVYVLEKSLDSFLLALFVFISHHGLCSTLVGRARLVWLGRVGFQAEVRPYKHSIGRPAASIKSS